MRMRNGLRAVSLVAWRPGNIADSEAHFLHSGVSLQNQGLGIGSSRYEVL